MFAHNEKSSGLTLHYTRVMSAQLNSNSPIYQWAACIEASQMLQRDPLTKDLLHRATSHHNQNTSLALWLTYLEYTIQNYPKDYAKNFFRALEACPWSYQLHLIALHIKSQLYFTCDNLKQILRLSQLRETRTFLPDLKEVQVESWSKIQELKENARKAAGSECRDGVASDEEFRPAKKALLPY